MRALILLLLAGPALAAAVILPTHPGTGAVDITQPGLRIQDGVIYQTLAGPLGIIDQSGTTCKREGNELVPHKGILGPQNFDLPSYQIQDKGGYRPDPMTVPLPAHRPETLFRSQGLLPMIPDMSEDGDDE